MAVLRPLLATAGGRIIMPGTPLDTTGVFARVWHDNPAGMWLKLRVETIECPPVRPDSCSASGCGSHVAGRGYGHGVVPGL